MRARGALGLGGIAAALCGLPAAAAAIEVTLYLQPGYAFTATTQTAGAQRTTTEAHGLNQRYQLMLSEQFYPQLRLDLGGQLNWLKAWSRTDAVETDSDQKVWTGSARLSFGGRPISGQLFFDQRRDYAETSTLGQTTLTPRVNRQDFGFSGVWAAEAFPKITVTLTRNAIYDDDRASIDTRTDDVYATAQYAPARPLDLRYSVRYEHGENRILASTAEQLAQTAAASFADEYLDGRLGVSATYTLALTDGHVRAQSPTAGVPVQLFPSGGLSLVEVIPATPERDRLVANVALVDGNLTASAGLNLGFNPSLASDTNYRDVGVAFTDPLTTASLLHVYVDRRLPPEIASQLQWSAWRSDDNDTWTAVPLAGSVSFGVVDNRFELRIPATQARYFKVVARPLALGVTQDRTYADVFVTEVQAFRVLSPGESGDLSSTTGAATAALRYLILPSVNLTYDGAATLHHTSARTQVAWSVSNGLSASKRVSRVFTLIGRVDEFLGRSQLAGGTATQSELRLTAGVAAEFMPTLRATLTYQGQLGLSDSHGTRTYQAALFGASADLYEGIGLSAQGSYTQGQEGGGQDFTAAAGSAGLGLTPNRHVALSGTFTYGQNRTRSPGQDWVTSENGFVQAAISLTPFPALSANASVSRYPWHATPSTVLSGSASFSPFPGGRLVLSFQYNESLDTAADSRNRTWGPTARWTLRPGLYVDAYYTRQTVSQPASELDSHFVFTTLTITL